MEGHATAAAVIEANAAPLGIADPTRRWALLGPDNEPYFSGVTRPEGVILGEALVSAPLTAWIDSLAEVQLPSILTDGAGPHLLASDGSLVIVLGVHDEIPGTSVAMGAPNPRHLIGLVEPVGPTGWTWCCCGEVAPDRHVDALDDLGTIDRSALSDWSARWASVA